MRANKKRGRPFFFLFLKNETLKKRGEKKGGSERQPVFWINDDDIVNLYGNTNFKDARRAGIHSSRNRRSTRRRRRIIIIMMMRMVFVMTMKSMRWI